MKEIEDNISLFVQNHFPQFYQEQGNTFIEFVKEYYNWSQQSNNNIFFSRNLLEYRDIDTTVDSFLYHFKQKYLSGAPVSFDLSRFNIKHVKDLYRSKGTERGTKLWMSRVYGVSDVEVYFPGQDVIKASDGEWIVPIYLEVSLSPKTADFVGKTVVGSASGATAFVEGIGRKSVSGKYFDVIFLSNVNGDFLLDEIVTTDGNLVDCPLVIGSLTIITINDAGRNFAVGDVVNVVSDRRGKQGKARIDSVETTTGKVSFTFLDGGTGYRLTTTPVVAEKMLSYTNKVASNNYVQNFLIDETVNQPLANIVFNSSNTEFSFGQLIIGANSTSTIGTVNATAITGTVTSNATSPQVNGTGTLFTTDLAAGGFVKFSGNNLVFQINTISNNTILNLTSNSAVITSTNTLFVVSNVPVGRIVGKVQKTISGTASANLTSNTVTGVNTSFSTQLANNDIIKFQACTSTFQISSIASNTSLTLTSFGPSVVANSMTAANGSFMVIVNSGDWSTPDRIQGSSALISSYTDKTATGKVMGINSTFLGITSVSNNFTSNDYNFLYGSTSNVYANVSLVGTGTGATFSVGSLTDEETVFLNTDLIKSNNSITTTQLTGTVSSNATSSQVNGTSTAFTTELYAGAYVTIGSNATVSITGRVTSNATSPQVNGIGTSFTTALAAGGFVKFSGNTLVFQINTISNNTILNLTTNSAVITSTNSTVGNTLFTLGVYQVNTISNNTILNLRTSASDAVSNTISITRGPYLTTPLNALKYGFPKLPTGNVSTLLNLALTTGSFDIGTIASLTSINPGSDYNIAPFVLVRDDTIANFNRRDLSVAVSNVSGAFAVGEELVQNFSTPAFTLQISGSNTSFTTNENVTQVINTTANGYGVAGSSNGSVSVVTVSSFSNSTFGNSFVNSALGSAITGTVTSNATSPQVNGIGTTFTSDLSAGDYIKFSGNSLIFQVNTISNNTILNLTTNSAVIVSTNSTVGNTISKATNVAIGMTSGVRFFVNTSIANVQLSISRGSVINSSSTSISVKRKTFNQSFTPNVSITGTSSGTTAAVDSVLQIEASSLMGNNAIVNTSAGIVVGSVTALSVIDSGFAYEDGEDVTLQNDANQFVATGYANLINQGVGEGYFKSTRGFLNSDKYIHDGDFYQFYSYQVDSELPLETYADTLKKIMHVAGTKLFGNVIKVSNVDVTIKSSGVEIDT